jgi:hypothetical protein
VPHADRHTRPDRRFGGTVLSAYGGRCAISHLPEPPIDAAHIVMDADEQWGQPIVSNGLQLTKIHHAAHPPRRKNKKVLIQNEISVYQSTP